jgi:hypothetical protein
MEKACGRAFCGIGGENNRNPIDPIATSNVELTMMRIEKSVDKSVIHMYVCYPWPQ